MSRPPEQQIVSEIDQIVFREDLPLRKPERCKCLPEDALRAVHLPDGIGFAGDLVYRVGKTLQQRRYFVILIRDEISLLSPRGDRMIALPDHVSFNVQLCQRHVAIRVGEVQNRQLEPVVGPIRKCSGLSRTA